MIKLTFKSKVFLSVAFIAVFLMTLVYFFPLHSESSMMSGSPCLFEVVNRTDCNEEIGGSGLVNQHLSSLQGTFTAIPTDTTLFITFAVLAFGLAAFLHREMKHIELYTQTIVKQKWREHQFIEKIFDPIKKALRDGILERKEPNLVLA